MRDLLPPRICRARSTYRRSSSSSVMISVPSVVSTGSRVALCSPDLVGKIVDADLGEARRRPRRARRSSAAPGRCRATGSRRASPRPWTEMPSGGRPERAAWWASRWCVRLPGRRPAGHRASRRQVDADDVDAVEEVLPEALLEDLLVEIAIRRCDEPCVEGYLVVRAHGAHRLLLEGAQDLRLHLEGHLRDLVQEERAAVSLDEEPAPGASRVREGPLHVAPERLTSRGGTPGLPRS